MTLIPADEVAAPPSLMLGTIRADPSVRASLESRKISQPDVINLEHLCAEETPTATNQSEPPVVTRAYNLDTRKLNIKFSAVCLALFLEGWNLGATGPLIPAIQKYYNVRLSLTQRLYLILLVQINYTLVSMIFLVQCVVSPPTLP